MPSLTECFKRFGIHPIEQTRIRRIAKAYREDGVKAVEAQNRAVLDYVKALEDEGGQIIAQIKGRFEVEKPPKGIQEEVVTKPAKPEAKVEGVKEITVGLDKPRKPEKFSDITRWVIKQGGVKPDDPNIDPVGWSRKQGGPIGLISKNARYGLDELATLLPEEGFPAMTTDELSEVISNRIVGGKAPRGYTDAEIARLEDEWNQERMDILESDPQILKPDTRNALTISLDDEIMALKEEWL